jgi:hypothetical protein
MELLILGSFPGCRVVQQNSWDFEGMLILHGYLLSLLPSSYFGTSLL